MNDRIVDSFIGSLLAIVVAYALWVKHGFVKIDELLGEGIDYPTDGEDPEEYV